MTQDRSSLTIIGTSAELWIPMSEIEFSYVRSSGPGGQNVNKVNSKAVLRWNIAESPSLSAEMRIRLLAMLGGRITREGDIVVFSDRFRDQTRNREDCLEKFRKLISVAISVQKKRKETRPTKSSRRKAKENKKRISEKKKLRGSRNYF